MRTLPLLPLLALLLAAPPALASDIAPAAGESSTASAATRGQAPLVRTECQFWDDFDKRCLYQRKIMTYGRMQCVEECQHWDDFANECRFATSCTFHRGQRRFVRTVCEEYDAFNATCLRTRQELIDGGRERP